MRNYIVAIDLHLKTEYLVSLTRTWCFGGYDHDPRRAMRMTREEAEAVAAKRPDHYVCRLPSVWQRLFSAMIGE